MSGQKQSWNAMSGEENSADQEDGRSRRPRRAKEGRPLMKYVFVFDSSRHLQRQVEHVVEHAETMRCIDMQRQYFSEIPDQLSRCTALEKLKILPRFDVLPSWIGTLPNLKTLKIVGWTVKSLNPASGPCFEKLCKLDVRDLFLDKPSVDMLGHLPNLLFLIANETVLQHAEEGYFPHLSTLFLQFVDDLGTLPALGTKSIAKNVIALSVSSKYDREQVVDLRGHECLTLFNANVETEKRTFLLPANSIKTIALQRAVGRVPQWALACQNVVSLSLCLSHAFEHDNFLQSYRHLKNLTLTRSGLTRIPSFVFESGLSLEKLNLAFNPLETIDPALALFASSLKDLTITGHVMCSLPPVLGQMEQLDSLHLTGMHKMTFCPELCQAPCLARIGPPIGQLIIPCMAVCRPQLLPEADPFNFLQSCPDAWSSVSQTRRRYRQFCSLVNDRTLFVSLLTPDLRFYMLYFLFGNEFITYTELSSEKKRAAHMVDALTRSVARSNI